MSNKRMEKRTVVITSNDIIDEIESLGRDPYWFEDRHIIAILETLNENMVAYATREARNLIEQWIENDVGVGPKH